MKTVHLKLPFLVEPPVIEAVGRGIATAIRHSEKTAGKDRQVILMWLIAGTVAAFDDTEWEQIRAGWLTPCGRPGCDCHKNLLPFATALDERRTWFTERAAIPGKVHYDTETVLE